MGVSFTKVDGYERSFGHMFIVLDKYQVTPMLLHLVGVELENRSRSLITGEIFTPEERSASSGGHPTTALGDTKSCFA